MTHARTPTQSGQYLTHAHSHINRAVAAMDCCFGLVRPQQSEKGWRRLTRITNAYLKNFRLKFLTCTKLNHDVGSSIAIRT